MRLVFIFFYLVHFYPALCPRTIFSIHGLFPLFCPLAINFSCFSFVQLLGKFVCQYGYQGAGLWWRRLVFKSPLCCDAPFGSLSQPNLPLSLQPPATKEENWEELDGERSSEALGSIPLCARYPFSLHQALFAWQCLQNSQHPELLWGKYNVPPHSQILKLESLLCIPQMHAWIMAKKQADRF